MLALRIIAFGAGLVGVAFTFSSAIRTVVVPRGQSLLLQRAVFRSIRFALGPLVRRAKDWSARDRILVHYAPFSLIALAIVWLSVVCACFTVMFWAITDGGWRQAFRISGSSITTLGFASTGTDWPGAALSVAEAVIGLILVALLISYLPTMYGVFSSREQAVSYMAVRAGTPPSGTELLVRLHLLETSDASDIWVLFEAWFNELAETHTSFMALPFFRSPNPERSWITTGGAVLDAAALQLSVVDQPRDRTASLCIRAGYTALREIASVYRIEVPDDPGPDDPVSVTRVEFDAVYDEIATSGVPVFADRDRAWNDFRGWRVNYDVPLVALSLLISAPYAPWSSDRSVLPNAAPGRSNRG